MKKILLLIGITLSFIDTKAQFPSTDSLRGYNIVWITNNSARAFTNYRLHTLIAGMIDWIDSARLTGTGSGGSFGIDSIAALNDSTIRYRKDGTFRSFTIKGVYDYRRKVDTVYKTNDSTIAYTINGVERTFSFPGRINFVDSIYKKTGQDSIFYRRNGLEYALLDSTGGLANQNIGLGFRILIPATQELKTIFPAYATTIDSTTNTNGITIGVDSATLSLYYLRRKDSTLYATKTDVLWQLNGTLLTPKANYYVKVQNPSTSNTGFSDWPYSTTFNKSVLGIYGKEPSLDILIDSSSQFQIGAIAFRSNKLATGGILDKFPKLPASRFSANAFAVIEANAFQNGGPWTSTIEFYLGDSTGNNTNVPLAASGPGNHFFGNRTYFTAEAKEALYFGTAINRVSNFTFGSLNTFFAGNLNNLPAYMLNAPTILADTTNNKLWVRNPSTGAMQAMYWPSFGGGGGAPGGSASEMQYRVDATTFGGGAGTSWDNTNSGLTINKTSLGVTQNNSAGYILTNTTAAAAGAQQISPAIRWLGNGWKTNATAESQTVEFRADVLPVQGAAAPSGNWILASSINGGAYSNLVTVTSAGAMTVSSTLTTNNSLTLGAANLLSFGARSVITSPTNGNLRLTNSSQSDFGLLQFGGTAATFPAWQRSTTKIIAMLADGSARTNVGVLDEAYSATTWDANEDVPTKNAIRDETETARYKPYSQTASLVTNTSDATPTNMSVLYGLTTLPDNSNGWFKVTLTGNGQNGASTHSLHGIKYYSYHKTGGTLTLDAADVIVADKKGASVSTATWQVIVSSNQPVIEVTGVTAITMVWGAAVEIVYVVEN